MDSTINLLLYSETLNNEYIERIHQIVEDDASAS